ncbi:MAG: PEP-CTERM sorting domain-containing protein [Akkermansiaceae bacterium]
MTKTNSTICGLSSAMLLSISSAPAAIVASWDDWANDTTYAADDTTTGFSATASIPTTGRANSSFGSTDGNYGDGPTGANTSLTGLLVRGSNGDNVVTITLNNATGSSYTIDSIHFDYGRRIQSPNAFSLVYTSGGLGIDGTTIGSDSGLITNVGFEPAGPGSGDQSVGQGDTYYEYDFTLASTLTDTTLDTGESAVFTLTFSGQTADIASGVLDNLAIQGTAVPEPSSAALLGLGGLALCLRRRK